MKHPVPISELEIVGYANALSETMLPSVVPPVFRVKGNPNQALVPPYLFNGGHLCDATALSASELDALRANEEVTLFDGDPLAARPDFELWLDLNGEPRYEPRPQADAALLALAKDYTRKAEQALRKGDAVETERLCGVALSADDRLVDPLVIKAVLCRWQKDITGEGLMEKLAARRMTAEAFRRLVDSYGSRPAPTHETIAQVNGSESDLLSRRVMAGMATMHAN